MSIISASTKYGKVRGAALDGKYEGITTFRSVPYAQPPVGELRWQAPVDPEPWVGELDATHFASRPMQENETGLTMEPWASDFYYMGSTPMSEDCLYLHITTGAADPSERRPVFMWFHGGGLTSGYYSEIEFDPSELARKGVVVVSVGQRLNVMGYLCLPQLMEEQGSNSAEGPQLLIYIQPLCAESPGGSRYLPGLEQPAGVAFQRTVVHLCIAPGKYSAGTSVEPGGFRPCGYDELLLGELHQDR